MEEQMEEQAGGPGWRIKTRALNVGADTRGRADTLGPAVHGQSRLSRDARRRPRSWPVHRLTCRYRRLRRVRPLRSIFDATLPLLRAPPLAWLSQNAASLPSPALARKLANAKAACRCPAR